MKKFVFIPVFLLLGMSIVTVTSCSKDEGESNKIENSEPTIPIPAYEMSGKYEGKWNDNDMETGNIEVYEDYIIIDELPTKAILTSIINEVRRNPESESQMVESIGNFFSASNYNFPRTDLVIRHQLESYSDGYYIFSVKSVKNIWSSISTIIDTDYEAPYPAKRIEIGPSDPLTISFGVEADGVPYRIDLISIEHEMDAKFNLSTERELIDEDCGLSCIGIILIGSLT